MHLGFSTLTRPGSPQPPTKCGTQQGPHRRAHGQWPQDKVSYYKVSNHLQLCGINSIHITTFTESVGWGQRLEPQLGRLQRLGVTLTSGAGIDTLDSPLTSLDQMIQKLSSASTVSRRIYTGRNVWFLIA